MMHFCKKRLSSFEKTYAVPAEHQVVPLGDASGLLLTIKKIDFTIAVFGWPAG
jgi:hypothetical protein